MFTGIIESIGRVEQVSASGTNKTFWIASPLSDGLTIDQSVSHDGVCLTVEEIQPGRHRVTAIAETLLKSNLGGWKTGTLVNIERCLAMNGRLDGHIVQGHVDTTATCMEINEKSGSREYRFRFPTEFAALIIEKGSISLNGISLTLFKVSLDEFSVAIIPYTLEHTNMKHLQSGDSVNIEFDMIGKYVNRMTSVSSMVR